MIGLKFRDNIKGPVLDEFEQLASGVRNAFAPEHNDDGTHGNITTNSIVSDGNITIEKQFPDIILKDTRGTTKAHIGSPQARLIMGINLSLDKDGANWNLDDPSQSGYAIFMTGEFLSFHRAAAGTNPVTPTQLVDANATFFTVTNPVSINYGQIYFPSTQNPASNANALDDYAEGDWTPVLTFGGASVGITYAGGFQVGAYTKVGRLVTCTGIILLTAKGTSVGNAIITGLPFTIGNGNKYYFSTKVTYNAFAAGVQEVGFQSIINTSTLNVVKSVAGTNTVMTDADFTNGSTLVLSFSYLV